MGYRFNPFTGTLDISGSGGSGSSDGFLPWFSVSADQTVTVPVNREMMLAEDLEILGEVVLLGRMIFIDADNNFTEIVLE